MEAVAKAVGAAEGEGDGDGERDGSGVGSACGLKAGPACAQAAKTNSVNSAGILFSLICMEESPIEERGLVNRSRPKLRIVQ